MTTYQSDIKTISSPEEVVFAILSDLNNLGKLQQNETVQAKVKIVEFDADSCLLELDQFGKVGFSITEKSPNKIIRFKASYLPVDLNASILLNGVADNQTRMQIVVHANIPSVFKMMLNSKLERGINSLADLFEKILNSREDKQSGSN